MTRPRAAVACVIVASVTVAWLLLVHLPGDEERFLEAVETGSLRRAASMLARSPELTSSASRYGSTPLHLAAQRGHLEVVELLVRHGAELDAEDALGSTPLLEAVSGAHADVAHMLLGRGADASNGDSNGRTPLHSAAAQDSLELAELLLTHNARVEAKDADGWTPLLQAIAADARRVSACLLRHGADIGARDSSGQTVLHLAARLHSASLLRALVAQPGCPSVHATDATGRTALDVAEEASYPPNVRALRELVHPD